MTKELDLVGLLTKLAGQMRQLKTAGHCKVSVVKDPDLEP